MIAMRAYGNGPSAFSPRFRGRALSMVAGLALIGGAAAGDSSPPSPGDVVCGPRCAQFVLEYFGTQTDLIALVRECQWPDIEAGCSLSEVDASLKRRGLYTAAIRVPEGCTLRWNSPAIMHLEPHELPALGHFVVWLPSSTPTISQVWAGLAGVQAGPTSDLWRKSSGAVLLVSDRPIANPAGSVEGAGESKFHLLAIVAGGGAIMVSAGPRCLPFVRKCVTTVT